MNNEKTWSSNTAFLLAAIGAAVGLGNIWRFPYIVGVSGGGAFVLVYLGCVIFIAIPILIAELLIGKLGHHSPPIAMERVAEEAGHSRHWSVIGWMGLTVGYLITTYYSVIAGWILSYIFKAANNFGGVSPAEVPGLFEQLLASPGTLIIWHSIFISMAAWIVSRGLRSGIERSIKILMPCLFLILLVMIGYAAIAGDFKSGFDFLFNADFTKINGAVVLTAIGQAFFSIGVAMGLMMTYGAYLSDNTSLTRSALVIAGTDTLIALLAGLMIFPLVFGNGLDPAEGPGLIFVTIPTALVSMPGGAFFGVLFFLLLAVAAITSIIAIIEPIVAYAEDRWNMRRNIGCFLFGFIAWLIGLASVFSFNLWADIYPLGGIELFRDKTIFDLIDYLTANIFMPIGAILISLFVGWRLKTELLNSELEFVNRHFFQCWLILVRFLAPLAILVIFVSNFY